MILLSPQGASRLGNGFSKCDLKSSCIESPTVLLENEARKIVHPLPGDKGLLLIQNVWKSPLFTTVLVHGHVRWDVKTSRRNTNLATTDLAVMIQCSHWFSRIWEVNSGDVGIDLHPVADQLGVWWSLAISVSLTFMGAVGLMFPTSEWHYMRWGSVRKCFMHHLIHRRDLKGVAIVVIRPEGKCRHPQSGSYSGTNQIRKAQYRQFWGQGHLRLWQKLCPWTLAINAQQLSAELTETQLERKRSCSLSFPSSLLSRFLSLFSLCSYSVEMMHYAQDTAGAETC